MQAFLRKLWTDESGQDMAEYVLLLVVIALVVVVGAQILGSGINTVFDSTGDALDGATVPTPLQ